MTPRAPSIEKSVEWIFTRVWFCRTFQKDSIRTNTVLKAEEFPAGVSCLDTCLPHMDRNALPLCIKQANRCNMEVKVFVTNFQWCLVQGYHLTTTSKVQVSYNTSVGCTVAYFRINKKYLLRIFKSYQKWKLLFNIKAVHIREVIPGKDAQLWKKGHSHLNLKNNLMIKIEPKWTYLCPIRIQKSRVFKIVVNFNFWRELTQE